MRFKSIVILGIIFPCCLSPQEKSVHLVDVFDTLLIQVFKEGLQVRLVVPDGKGGEPTLAFEEVPEAR